MSFVVKGIGDQANRVNEITPRLDAQILNFISQAPPGVWWTGTAHNHFGIGISGLTMTIWMGLVQAFGYFAMSDRTQNITVIRPATGVQFARVFAEINLSRVPNEFRIGITPQSTSSNIGLIQNDLVQVPNGIHQIPLYLITINSSGVITFTDQRPRMNRIQNSEHANDSTNSVNARNLIAGGTINNTATAVTQTRTNNSTRLSTTAFVHSVVDWANRLRNDAGLSAGNGGGRATLPNGMIIQWREGNTQNETFPLAFPTMCFAVWYGGHWGNAANQAPWGSDISIERENVSRTGFRWRRQSGTGSMNQRRYIAIGW